MPRIHSIDYLKLLIASGIVWAHAIMLSGQGGAVEYVIGQGLVRSVVPTFAVISGFLFHSTFQRGKAGRWILQLAGIYAFWWVVYLPGWLPFMPDARSALKEAIFGPLHLWYVVALIMAVCMIVVILRIAGPGRTGRRALFWLGLLALVTGTALHGADYFGFAEHSMHVYRNGPFMIFPYAALGFLVADRARRDGEDWVPCLRAGWTILLVLAALRIGEALLGLALFGASYDAPPEFPLLAAAFSVMFVLVALRIKMPEPPVNLAFLSMVIYFLHFMVVATALDFGIRNVAVLTGLGVAVPALLGFGMMALGPLLSPYLPVGWARRIKGEGSSGQP